MDHKFAERTQNAKTLSRKAKLLLVAVLVAATATGALALFQPSPPPVSSPAAVSNADVPQMPLARERAEDHQYLSERSALSAARVAATLRQEELKDRWLERTAAANEVAAPMEREMFEQHKYLAQQNEAAAANEVAAPTEREMFEQHKYLAQQNGAAAASRRQQELKDAWLERGSTAAPAELSPAQRHEALKDAWLERGSTAAPAELSPLSAP
jgi:hypothetical protein